VTDDERYALTAIAFVGSVFSSRYALARRRGPADPLDFCALNVVVYGPDRKLWTLTEWPRSAIFRNRDHFQLGPNVLRWRDGLLDLQFDERTAPFGDPLRGVIRLYPEALFDFTLTLDEPGRHRWRPIAPIAHVEVELSEPALRFSGSGYHDHNWGDEPLEAAFHSWNWSRAKLPHGAAILYDAQRKIGGDRSWGGLFKADGTVGELAAPRSCRLPTGLWGVERETRTDGSGEAKLIRNLETSPFYERALLRTHLAGHQAVAVHEALSCDRFAQLWVQLLLPFKTRSRSAQWRW
jgi:carotenoid 1,2-hydratase